MTTLILLCTLTFSFLIITNQFFNKITTFNPVLNSIKLTKEERFNILLENLWYYFKWNFLNSSMSIATLHVCSLFFLSWCCRGLPVPAVISMGGIYTFLEYSNTDNLFTINQQLFESTYNQLNTTTPEYFKNAKNQFEKTTLAAITAIDKMDNTTIFINNKSFQESIKTEFGITQKKFLGNTTKLFKVLYFYHTHCWEILPDQFITKQASMISQFHQTITDNTHIPHRHYCIQHNSKENITYYQLYTLTSTGISPEKLPVTAALANCSKQQFVNVGNIEIDGLSPLKKGNTSLIHPTGKILRIDQGLIQSCIETLSIKLELLQNDFRQALNINTEQAMYTKLSKLIDRNKMFLKFLEISLEKTNKELDLSLLREVSFKVISIDISHFKATIHSILTEIPEVSLSNQKSIEKLQIAMEKVETTPTISPIQEWNNKYKIENHQKPQVQSIYLNKIQAISTHPEHLKLFKKAVTTVAKHKI